MTRTIRKLRPLELLAFTMLLEWLDNPADSPSSEMLQRMRSLLQDIPATSLRVEEEVE